MAQLNIIMKQTQIKRTVVASGDGRGMDWDFSITYRIDKQEY